MVAPRQVASGEQPTQRALARLRVNHPRPGRSEWVSLYELVLVSECRSGGARNYVRLREDVADVPVDGLLAQRQLTRNRLVGLAARDQAQHLQLAPGQSAVFLRRALADVIQTGHERFDCGEIRPRAELLED